jgi:DNA polymerase III delta subunit
MAKGRSGDSKQPLSSATRLVVLHGDDRFQQDLHLAFLRERLAEAQGAGGGGGGGGDDALQVVRFDGAPGGGAPPAAMADILDECRSFGLMAPFKLVVVDNADALLKAGDEDDAGSGDAPARRAPGPARRGQRSNRELLEAYAADPSDSAALVLRARTWRPGRLDKAVAALGPSGAIIKCEPPTPAEAVAWARDRCARHHGATLAPDAAGLLVENLGPDLGRIDAELGKLALADPGRPITADLVRQFVGPSREEEFWRIERSLLSGDARQALAHLRELVDVSRHDPVPLNWAFVNLARKVHGLARGIAQGANPWSLRGPLKIWGSPEEFEQLLRIARKVPPRRAAALLQAAIDNDVRLKTSQGDPVINLESLALRFTSEFA